MAETGLAAIISSIGSFVTGAISWMSSYITAIASNDLLVLAVVCIPLVGLGAGLVRRLVSIKA